MAGTIWTVTAEFDGSDDAIALAELIKELGYNPIVSSRQIESPRNPLRATRLGRMILKYMRENPSHNFSIEDIQDLCVKNDYQPTSAAAALSVLAKEGDLDRSGVGLYRLRQSAPEASGK